MLALSRNVGEWIVVTTESGEQFKFKPTRVRKAGPNDRVTFAFDAPPTVKIMREEVAASPQK